MVAGVMTREGLPKGQVEFRQERNLSRKRGESPGVGGAWPYVPLVPTLSPAPTEHGWSLTVCLLCLPCPGRRNLQHDRLPQLYHGPQGARQSVQRREWFPPCPLAFPNVPRRPHLGRVEAGWVRMEHWRHHDWGDSVLWALGMDQARRSCSLLLVSWATRRPRLPGATSSRGSAVPEQCHVPHWKWPATFSEWEIVV